MTSTCLVDPNGVTLNSVNSLIRQSQGYDGRQTDIYERPVAIYYIYMVHIAVWRGALWAVAFPSESSLCPLQEF